MSWYRPSSRLSTKSWRASRPTGVFSSVPYWAAGYRVLAINRFSGARCRERTSTSGAKSDPGDVVVLADIVRTDWHQHRPVAGDSELAEAIKILARAHQW
jgi:hypothetical protein